MHHAAVELLAPEKMKLFQSVCLSWRTISDWITDLEQYVEETLKNSARDFQFFSLAYDETMAITNTAQMTVFVHGMTVEFDMREELLLLEVMHGTARGAINGIIHEESLCAWLTSAMSTVVSCKHSVKSRGFNNCQFKELLDDLDSEYIDLYYHCEVRWLSCSYMLMRFYELRDKVKQFMEIKENMSRNSAIACGCGIYGRHYQTSLRAEHQGAGPKPASQLPALKHEII